jgi:penicillin-binding protein 2
MYLEPIRKRHPPSDDPSIAMRLSVIAVVAVVFFAVLGFRLWYLQVLSGDHYTALANDNRLRNVTIEAPRGVVYDRNGKVLVQNRGGLSVGILPMDLTDDQVVIPRLAQVLGVTAAEIRQKLAQGAADPYRVVVIKEDVPQDPTVAYLKEHSLEFPGVRVETTFLRSYPDKTLAAQVLGYVGEVSDQQLQTDEFKMLASGARIGKDGVEFTYDRFLRGVDGTRTVEVDATGRPKQTLQEVPPQPGDNLVLSLDSGLQAAADRALAEGIVQANKSGFKNAAAGSVVALDPTTGQVLAMASLPSYDPSVWVGGMSQATFNQMNAPQAHQPLLNRAIEGLYPAGSTFKPFVAATALRDGLITPATIINAPPTFRIGQQVWKDWNPGGHGLTDLVKALTESVDVYFYNVGKMFYDQTGAVLQDGLRQFGFGQKTGIDLPGETIGRVPDKVWKKQWGQTALDQAWKPGDDVNLAIGQGDLLVTPLQLATAFGAIANAHSAAAGGGGPANDVLDLLVPHLGLRITDPSGNVVHTFETQTKSEITMKASDLDAIRQGLLGVASQPNGTAYATFKDFPIPVAGKTGTAQKAPEDDYAWFAGYAPANDPKIVVVALVEQGGHGSSVAAPIVRQVMAQYFKVKSPGPAQVGTTE